MFPFIALFASLPLVLAGAHAPLSLSGSVSVSVGSSTNAGSSPATYPSNKQCVRDQCARQVVDAFKYASPSRSSDCAALYSTITVTPAAVTKTVTSTPSASAVTQTSSVSTATTVVSTSTIVTTDSTIITTATTTSTDVVTTTETSLTTSTTTVSIAGSVSAVFGKRGAATTKVPQWACDCSDVPRFSSACGCAGFTQKTVTASAPTTYVTVTAATPTTTAFINGKTTVSATATTTQSVQTTTTSTITTAVQSQVTSTTTQSFTTTATVGAAPAFAGYCADGSVVDGSSTGRTTPGSGVRPFRIEGKDTTLFEGFILSGPQNITTPSGGTHLCDGTNNNANPAPIVTGTDMIADSAGLCGFDFDGTYSNQFQDFFITRIGNSDSNDGSNRFWGILDNFQFTPTGGCQYGAYPGSSILWAFDAFNAQAFLSVSPGSATLRAGQSATFSVRDGMSGQLRAGASFAGQIADATGNVVFTVPAGTAPGVYRYKATQTSCIRSNAVIITVTA